MSNKLLVIGRMFELSVQPLTKRQFDKLIKEGRNSKLYEKLIEQSGSFIESAGYYLLGGKPTFEVFINDQSLEIEGSFKTDYQITYHPMQRAIKSCKGREKYYLITERGYKNGHSGIEFDEPFDSKGLSFEVYREGLSNKTICSTITPMYRNKELDFYWNWFGYDCSYICSSKGNFHNLE